MSSSSSEFDLSNSKVAPIDEESAKTADSSSTPFPEASGMSPPTELELSESIKAVSPAPSSVSDAVFLKLQFYHQSKALPWKPKVKQRELELFLDQERKKFLGYGDLGNDVETLIGLPYPIHESVKVLKQHMYISLNDEQIKLEEMFSKYPLSTKAKHTLNQDGSEPAQSPAEILFASLLNNLPQYLVNKVLFGSYLMIG